MSPAELNAIVESLDSEAITHSTVAVKKLLELSPAIACTIISQLEFLSRAIVLSTLKLHANGGDDQVCDLYNHWIRHYKEPKAPSKQKVNDPFQLSAQVTI